MIEGMKEFIKNLIDFLIHMEFENIICYLFFFIVFASHKIELEIGKELTNHSLENPILRSIVHETIVEFLQIEFVLYMEIMNDFELFAFNTLLTSYLSIYNRNQYHVDA